MTFEFQIGIQSASELNQGAVQPRLSPFHGEVGHIGGQFRLRIGEERLPGEL